MIKNLIKNTSLFIYLKYLRWLFLPSIGEREEIKMNPERLSFYRAFVQRGDLCFDVGANIGNRASIFLELGARVVAIEPQPECCRMLRLRLGRKIEIVEAAVGESETEGIIFISETSEISSLSTEWIDAVSKSRFKNKNWTDQKAVKITTLDHLIEKFGLPSFCKVDVEGFEEEVFAGLTKKIACISFEYTIPERLSSVQKCLQRLEAIGDIECNYTIGERMEFEERNWVSGDELVLRLNNNKREGMFGDIYVRFQKNRSAC